MPPSPRHRAPPRAPSTVQACPARSNGAGDRHSNKVNGVGDAAGIALSTLCLIHCLAAPLLLALLPALSWAVDERVHQALVVLALLAALAGLLPGYRAHRRPVVLLLGGLGLVFLATGAFIAGPYYGAVAESCLSVAGALLLCGAHLLNRNAVIRLVPAAMLPAAPACAGHK